MTFICLTKNKDQKMDFEVKCNEDIWLLSNGLDIQCFTDIYIYPGKDLKKDIESFKFLIMGKVKKIKDISGVFEKIASDPTNSVADYQYASEGEAGLPKIIENKDGLIDIKMECKEVQVSKYPSLLKYKTYSAVRSGKFFTVVDIKITPGIREKCRLLKLSYVIGSRSELSAEGYTLRLYPHNIKGIGGLGKIKKIDIGSVIKTRKYGIQLRIPETFSLIREKLESQIKEAEKSDCIPCNLYCPYVEKIFDNIPAIGKNMGNFFLFYRKNTIDLKRWNGITFDIFYRKSFGEERKKIEKYLIELKSAPFHHFYAICYCLNKKPLDKQFVMFSEYKSLFGGSRPGLRKGLFALEDKGYIITRDKDEDSYSRPLVITLTAKGKEAYELIYPKK